MGSVVAGAGVNPADQRWGFWPLLPLSYKLWKWFEMIVPSFLCNWAEIWATASLSINNLGMGTLK